MPASLLDPPHHARRRTAHSSGVGGSTADALGAEAINRGLSNITLPFLCATGAIALLSNPMATSGDGANTVPFVALLGIALETERIDVGIKRLVHALSAKNARQQVIDGHAVARDLAGYAGGVIDKCRARRP